MLGEVGVVVQCQFYIYLPKNNHSSSISCSEFQFDFVDLYAQSEILGDRLVTAEAYFTIVDLVPQVGLESLVPLVE